MTRTAREQERQAPAPGEELLGGELGGEVERDGGQADTGRGAHLRERAVEAALALGGVLDGHQGGAAPLTADGEALHQPQHRQQDGGEDADGRVGGHQAHEHGRGAHGDEGDDEHLLAAHAVTEVAEHHAADRAGEEPDTEGGERQQGADEGVELGKNSSGKTRAAAVP